ncbi:MAG: prepilin-type N-terminal cleavage/methylation domain-containing protein [Desulfobacteria bacterium]
MPARDARRGFTLLELLIALTILAMIAGSVAAGIRLSVASIGRGEAVTRDAARLRAAVGVLERALMSADPLPIPVGDNTTAYFAGEEKSVRFLTAGAPSAVHGGGLRLISFFERTGGEGGGIAVATSSPFRAEGAERWEGKEKSRILVPGGGELAFSYSPGPTEEGAWEWLPAWDPKETGRLPAAVRVEFSVPSPSGPRKTAFVVPVPAGGGIGG